MFSLVVSLFLFIFGAVIGSFLCVIAIRFTSEDSWMTGRSRCESCKKQIAWYDNLPIISYLFLRGKCRKCRTGIAPVHFFVELGTGIFFVWWYQIGFQFFTLSEFPLQYVQPLFWLLVGIISIVIITVDYLYYLIPDWCVIGLLSLVVSYKSLLYFMHEIQLQDVSMSIWATIIITAFFYSLWWLTGGRGFGFGDVKLIIPLSLMLGWQEAVVAVFLSFVLGSVIGLLLMWVGGYARKHPVPFGPFLILGSFIGALSGNDIFNWYINTFL